METIADIEAGHRKQCIAHVVVDVPSRELDTHFDYAVPPEIEDVSVGSCVLVDFSNRPVVGYVLALTDSTPHKTVKPLRAVLAGPFFGPASATTARWIASEYAAPLSEAVRLFTPPGGTPRFAKVATAGGGESWTLRRADVGAVDDRWAFLAEGADAFRPKTNATMQRAVLDALAQGPVRVAELAADLGALDSTLRRLEELGVVGIEHRRRMREAGGEARPAPRPARLTDGQQAALDAIESARNEGGVVLLDGVTGSGKTEVYLQAIERTLAKGQTACVLVPEISLTPQTVGRFRTRFGDIAVLHSRLSAGERFDQWDRVRAGDARIVVGARSALFAPLAHLGLIVIDEEHEPSYKQGSSPRYHARDVAAHLAREHGAVLVLGSATPSLESLERCETGEWTHVMLPERVSGRALPSVEVVDMAKEFAEGHRSMFSRPLLKVLAEVVERGEKAVMFLNRRGFASFLLCRECGYVPRCDSCTTSLTFHEVGSRLACHHCGAVRAVPVTCPRCNSPYLRKFGAGTQRVEAELLSQIPGVPIVRMDADTTQGKGGHERALAAFESIEGAGVLLGTQMIAKGLDYPEVTLVAVIDADTTLHLPDFRASERTYQLLEQVAGRGGRGERPGRVVIQTYWPDHPAIQAVAAHDPTEFRAGELAERRALGYPPFGRLANVRMWGPDSAAVARSAQAIADVAAELVPPEWTLVGPSPAPLSRLKGMWRWHLLVKAPPDAPLGPALADVVRAASREPGVLMSADIDPADLL